MSKKIVRITESDLVKIVKRVINEQGGYDDPYVMSTHSARILGELSSVVNTIASMVDQAVESIERDIPKNQFMIGLTRVTDVLEVIEERLGKIKPEVMLNNDLKISINSLKNSVKRGIRKLRALSSISGSFINPDMPEFISGGGLSMNSEDLNDKISLILLDISKKASELIFQIKDEENNMFKRFDSFN